MGSGVVLRESEVAQLATAKLPSLIQTAQICPDCVMEIIPGSFSSSGFPGHCLMLQPKNYPCLAWRTAGNKLIWMIGPVLSWCPSHLLFLAVFTCP